MGRPGKLHSSILAGWACFAFALAPGHAIAADSAAGAQWLKQADELKTSDNKQFLKLLNSLDDRSSELSGSQLLLLRYLHAWQGVYEGRYEAAVSQLDDVIAKSPDPTLRFRAGVTAVNALALATHYQEGYSRLSQLLDQLPQVPDREAREQGLLVAGILYNQAGQYDLGLNYAITLLQESRDDKTICHSEQIRLEALYKSGKLHAVGKELQDGIDACRKSGEMLYGNYIRTFAAKLLLDQGRIDEATRMLQDNYPDVEASRYPRLISEYDAMLAEAHWRKKDLANAKLYAERAINDGVRNQITKPLADAYYVLYEVAKQQGETGAALDFHERYAAADKGYLNDTSARTLAYQMVKQQVQEKKQQLDALSKQNQLLQLKQQVDAKTAEAGKLLILLLLTLGGSVALYAFRTKRSEVKFMKLARRDGLTDIYNRQYFVEAAEQELAYCQKSLRDVSVIVIDLDHFKNINDTHGHAAGDFALKRAVAMCQQHIRSVDVFGRLGGEEFGILMPDCVPERAADQAELMRLSIERLVNTEEGPEFPVHASFGISAARWSGYDLRQLLAHADSALYQAKREGRNRVVVHAGAAANGAPQPGVNDRRRTTAYTAHEDVRR